MSRYGGVRLPFALVLTGIAKTNIFGSCFRLPGNNQTWSLCLVRLNSETFENGELYIHGFKYYDDYI